MKVLITGLVLLVNSRDVEDELVDAVKKAKIENCAKPSDWCRQAAAFLEGEAPAPEELLKPTLSRELNQGAHLALLLRREGAQWVAMLLPVKPENAGEQQEMAAYVTGLEKGKPDTKTKLHDYLLEMAATRQAAPVRISQRSLCMKDLYGPGDAEVIVRKQGRSLYAVRTAELRGKSVPVFAEFPLPPK